ncbi:MAG: type II toxin-antitoxin system VapC family toxin [Chloroflexi bacterium]|nr:type II toxin-antitoxin system VapC family toxin [Chloroflexota bacterium]
MQRLFGQKCLLDTNVLLYALDKSSRYFAQASGLLTGCVEGQVSGFVAHQNLLELLHVLTVYYHVPASEALRDVRALADHPRLSIIYPTSQTLSLFFQLAQTHVASRIEIFDLYLAATMKQSGLAKIVTANTKDFRHITDLEIIDLATLTL